MENNFDNDGLGEFDERMDGLTLQQKLALEDLIVETAFNNSFLVFASSFSSLMVVFSNMAGFNVHFIILVSPFAFLKALSLSSKI